ncbi:hypothetical protein [Oceanihabitans sediminis]|uniref:hypothetical protein n=1 Tax=Oceanihabitans sediminis TaxID=1812012 RepID=UPI00299D2CC1|nr:hypothetical protein [Oceanihabitans sediminis]MDX1772651.1 hypothetical protein [Oceanihabitans sediminis]
MSYKENPHSLNISNNDLQPFKDIKFWAYNSKTKKYSLLPAEFQDWLESNNFYKHGNLIIKIDNSIATVYTPIEVYNFALKYIKTQKNTALRSAYLTQADTLLLKNKGILASLQSLEISPAKDTKTESYIFFKNVFCKITKEGFTPFNYNRIKEVLKGRFIFKSKIIDKSFDINADFKEAQFYEFLQLSTNGKEHLLNVLCTKGYLLHNYKNPSNAKAIVISDIDSQATNTAQGRSGKGILIQALSEILEVIEYNGKNLDLSKDKFVYQSIIPLITQLFVLQDVQQNFDFEALFSIITDKMNLERKHKEKQILSFEDSPKIALTTNYTIPDNGGSFTDRKHLLLLNNHFNSSNKPENHFGNLFFLEWNESEYSRFFALMIHCIEMFLKHGLVKYNSPELQLQKLENETNKHFVEVMETEFNMLNSYYNLKDIAAKMGAEINSEDDRVKSRITSKWVESWASFKGYKIDKRTSGGITKLCFSTK